jgi:hypothetical protein
MNVVGKTKSILLYLPARVRQRRIMRDLSIQLEEWEKRIGQVGIEDIRTRTLSYIERLRVDQPLYGSYRYSDSQSVPVLYASTYAAMTRHLYGDLQGLADGDREQWLEYFAQHQDDDGFFKDPQVESDLAVTEDWWGWRHLTLQVITSVTALGNIVLRPFAFLTPFLDLDNLTSWLESRDWNRRPDFVSNEVQNIGAALQYSRDFHNDQRAGRAVECLLDWLESTQDPQTGLWGRPYDTPALLSRGVQTGYHLWLLFFYDKRPVLYLERIIDSVLATQNELGGFGVVPNSSACEDIDSIDPLVRLSLMTDYRRDEVQAGLRRALPWVLVNMNDDGGFVFRRGQKFLYGHERMSSGRDESAMFPTWFRTLSLAYLAQALPDKLVGHFAWQFPHCPGLQFFERPKGINRPNKVLQSEGSN